MRQHDDPGENRLRKLARASSLAMDPGEYADVPAEVVDRLRAVCMGLPDVVERPAWAGTQWRIRDRMFAHVLAVDFPDGPVTVLVLRSSGEELDALRSSGHPFFTPAWGKDAVGRVLDADDLDRDGHEITELVTDSYCTLAPKKLVAQVRQDPDHP